MPVINHALARAVERAEVRKHQALCSAIRRELTFDLLLWEMKHSDCTCRSGVNFEPTCPVHHQAAEVLNVDAVADFYHPGRLTRD